MTARGPQAHAHTQPAAARSMSTSVATSSGPRAKAGGMRARGFGQIGEEQDRRGAVEAIARIERRFEPPPRRCMVDELHEAVRRGDSQADEPRLVNSSVAPQRVTAASGPSDREKPA